MILYHASTVVIDTPDVSHSRDKLDFGRGFYLISIREALGRLKYEKPNHQMCILNDKLLDKHLHFLKAEKI